MNTIRLILFGSLIERLGFQEMHLDIRDLDALQAWLLERDPSLQRLPLLYAVNQTVARENTALQAGDEVAVMPPFAGG